MIINHWSKGVLKMTRRYKVLMLLSLCTLCLAPFGSSCITLSGKGEIELLSILALLFWLLKGGQLWK